MIVTRGNVKRVWPKKANDDHGTTENKAVVLGVGQSNMDQTLTETKAKAGQAQAQQAKVQRTQKQHKKALRINLTQ